MVPFQSVMIPLYYLLQDFNMIQTYWAFIVPGIALRLPFGIFLMRGFFRGLPKEIADAARVDGANEWHVFRQIMLPLATPGLATLVVFQFMNTWNQFLMPLIFVQKDDLRPGFTGDALLLRPLHRRPWHDRGWRHDLDASGGDSLPDLATPVHRGHHSGGAQVVGRH